MKLRILGSGTSTGVPEIGCKCEVCTSADPRDNRLRASSLLHTDGAVILIDCGPDFREQMLRVASFEKIDGVLITHEHYDHVGGLDDLRPFCRFGEIPIYSDNYTATHLRARMPYCFLEHKYPGVPQIFLQEVEPGKNFFINHTEIIPFQVMHGRLPILGYRIGKRLAYITEEMETESRNINTFAHKDYLKYLVKMFLIYIQRIGQRGTGIPLCINNSSNRTFVQFRQTLEHHYRHIHTVKEYANYLNVSTKTLTNCVYESSHSTPLKIINDRVILEAKRQLLHSSLKIKEIAFYLGFEDPSYFVKFFKRQTGYLPAEFRE